MRELIAQIAIVCGVCGPPQTASFKANGSIFTLKKIFDFYNNNCSTADDANDDENNESNFFEEVKAAYAQQRKGDMLYPEKMAAGAVMKSTKYTQTGSASEDN